jgi:hypothetical protein
MESLPNEMVCNILTFVSEYSPALRETCARWDAVMDVVVSTKRAKPTLTVEQLAYRGHTDLIETIGKDNISHEGIRKSMISASAKGRVETMNLLKKWGASNYNRALSAAAAGDYVTAMKLLKTWGATEYNWALAEAAREGCTEAIALLYRAS